MYSLPRIGRWVDPSKQDEEQSNQDVTLPFSHGSRGDDPLTIKMAVHCSIRNARLELQDKNQRAAAAHTPCPLPKDATTSILVYPPPFAGRRPTQVFTPQTGTPDNALANPTPNAMSMHPPSRLIVIIIITAAPLGLTSNSLDIELRIRSKCGDIAIDNANRAGLMTFSITENPA